ncbi:MAG: HupV protein [Comamonadaceae bacterium CG_4_9_14_3_um_filter_60_33]|nr:MAG: HupV protein [Comamonadaceae bacterium CG2_30_59_20]PIY29179.1 MAG: HupV protein [Comamonadaceae bacterium CG_4_10_14_3_um_filter_60_42]PJB44498.1 MAG: HupV protein [Comamonadaceae bacterium CG_4_9_14_3_um_filter_60_33]
MTRRLVLGPFNRVEGDLEVQLDVADGLVKAARVNAPMFRGFELMLAGREPMDALTIVPRICGICSVSQSVAAARALADACGVVAPPNGELVTNLMLACENLADHLTHFYLFFMPDFTSPVYAGRRWYAQAQQRFAALAGSPTGGGLHSRMALAARARWFELVGTLGGKWPHTGTILPGGSARAIEATERVRLLARVREMRAFLEQTLFGTPLEEVAALHSLAALEAWRQRAAGSDLALFLDIADDTGLAALGPGPGRYLSYGAYAQADGTHAFARGVWSAAQQSVLPLDTDQITEDPRHAWYAEPYDVDVDAAADANTCASPNALHPSVGSTQPQADKAGAYTWNKAPRLAGQVLETGAIARQLVDGQPLIRAAVAARGGCVSTRVLARLLEVARIVPLMTQWLQALQPHAPFYAAHTLPDNAQGVGLTEAARGALGHWLRIENGRLSHYQIVAPTSWNFSPRDAAGTPGALEAALVGAPLDNTLVVSALGDATGNTSVAVQHIVRSFDPCMVCTVH